MKRSVMFSLIIVACVLAFVAMSSRVEAISISVTNYSFENPVLADGGSSSTGNGWAFPSGATGIFNPTASQGTATDGYNVAFNNGNTILSQMLTALLTANTQYTLTVDIISRNESSVGAGSGSIILYAGGYLVGNILGTNFSAPPVGTAITTNLVFTTGSSDPRLGQNLAIGLAWKSGTQVLFDNVRLDATPSNSTTVPEPATILLLGLGLMGIAGIRRKFKG